MGSTWGVGLLCFLLILQMACRAKGVFHVTVPAPPKVSMFQNVAQSMPVVTVSEDSTETQSFIILMPPEAFQQKTSQGVVQKNCGEILAVSSSDQTMVLNSTLTVSDTAGGCQISFIPNTNASGDLQLIASSIANPTDQFSIPVTITAVNDQPFVADISPVTSGDDFPTVISVPLADDTPGLTCSQAISATSSNQTLLPSSSISAIGTLPDCQITFTPVANQSGSTLLTVTISDGQLAVTKTITVSVTAVNDPPTISDVSNQTIIQDTVLSGVSVSISDPDSTLNCNSITASSSNTTLIPSGNVTISGAVPNCLISMSPAASQSGTANITLTVSDDLSLSASDSFVLTVNQVNSAPTDLSLSSLSLAENSGANAVVGSLSATDPDIGDSYTYTLASGTGSTDNASFNILGNQLRLTASADFETKSSYDLRIRVIDQGGLFFEKQFTITITNLNESPTNLALSSLSLAENSGSNAVVGNLSATDTDASNTFTYTLVAGTGSTDNGSFNILGSQLRMTDSADFETNYSYSILLRATDQGGLFFEKQLNITITNLNEAPTLAAITDQITLEDTELTVALSPFDADGNLSCTSANFLYSSSNPNVIAASGDVSWSGTWPSCFATITPVFNNSGLSSLTITVTDGSLTASQIFNLAVTSVNDPPTISDVTNQTTNQDTVLSEVSVSILDPDSTLTCNSITASSSNTTLIPSGNVTISGVVPNCLISMSPAVSQSGTSTITLTVSDDLSLSASDRFVLTVTTVNSAPNDLSLSSLSLAENSGANAVVGTLSAADPDTGDTYTYTLVSGTGSTDNSSFTVLGNQLRLTASADFETKSSYALRIRVADQGSLYFEKEFTITITDINEAPSLSAIGSQTTNQDTPTAAIPLTVIDVDGPAGTCNATYLSYTSQNPSIISSTGAVSWAGTWPNCTAVFNPVNGATGTSLISISVSDGLLTSAPHSFNLQVGNVPNGWYQEAYIKASNAKSGDWDYFGSAVSISGDSAIVGAWFEDSNQTFITNGTTSATDNSLTDSGAGYVYRRSGFIWIQEAYLKPVFGGRFGEPVSISGDSAIVGATADDVDQTTITNGTNSIFYSTYTGARGASYIYRRSGSSWTQEAYIKSSNLEFDDSFGKAVALSGDWAIVAATNEDSNQTTVTNGPGASSNNLASNAGASYIYRRAGSTWAQEAYLKASNANSSDLFGIAVSISGDTAIVGAFGEASNQTTITNGATSSLDNSALYAGASYIYRRTGTTWAQEAYLKASNANANDDIGNAVSISGDTAIVGAFGEASNQTTITNGATSSLDNSALYAGASYIYRRTGTNWAQEAYIKSSNANSGDRFGNAVSISGDTAIVGAYGEGSNQTTITNGATSSPDNAALLAGASYIYRRTGTNWAQEAYIKASNANSYDEFGNAVSISGDTAIVGANKESSNQTVITNGTGSSTDNSAGFAGAVYVFRNLSRMFEPYDVASAATSSSFVISWKGSNLGTANGYFKVVYASTTPAANCSGDTVAYTGTDTSISVASGLTPGQSYIVRICAFDGVNYSEGVTSQVTIKGDDIGPAVLSINRGGTPNPVPLGTSQLDYVVTFTEPVTNLIPENFSLTEVVTSTGASGKVSSVSCSGIVCTVWVVPGNAGQLRLDLTDTAFAVDNWGNKVTATKTGDETYSIKGWYQEAYIKASNSEGSITNPDFSISGGDSFGRSLSISGDNVIVGASFESSIQTTITNGSTASSDNSAQYAGASYIYRRTGTNWAQEAYVKASNANADDYFGHAVSISGDTAIVGAGESSNQTTITNGATSSLDNTAPGAGASYIYRRTGTNWAQEAYIKASNANSGANFGHAVSISGDTAIVGAIWESSNQTTITNGATSSLDNTLASAGASFIYRRTGSSWAQEAYIKASNSNASDAFGHSVSLSGDTAIVGAVYEDSNQTVITNGPGSSTANSAQNAGASYIYRRTGLSWAQEAYLKASNSNASDAFGHSVSVSGDTAIVGALYEDSMQVTVTNGTTSSTDNYAKNSGASYIYRRAGSTWAQEAYIKASNAEGDSSPFPVDDQFGVSVAVSGDTVIVGAENERSIQTIVTNGSGSSPDNSGSKAGASYIYRRVTSVWAQEAYIKASNANTGHYLGENFGYAVSISGDTAIVGSYNEASNQTTITIGPGSSSDNTSYRSGAVFVYRSLARIFEPHVMVSAKTTTSITLSWGSNLGSASQVKIAPVVLGTGNPLPCADSNAIALSPGVTTYTYSGLTSGTKYGFRVCGFDGTNVGEGSVIWEDTN